MSIKKFLIKIYAWPLLSKDRINFYQEKIRNAEWEAVKPYIPQHTKFLDVGCGSGFTLRKAREECKCEVRGIDPFPGAHGVNQSNTDISDIQMDKGVSESLPYEKESFDIVFCSHVLEHVTDIPRSLSEMNRVLKANGTLIIGMPTATMSWIGLFTQLVFTTHIRVFSYFMKRVPNTPAREFKYIFLPPSHGKENKTVLYDINHYRISKWTKIIKSTFLIHHILLPALYPYPDFRQLFPLKKIKGLSSSVFFVCHKIKDKI